jgi:Bacterial SH3 domain
MNWTKHWKPAVTAMVALAMMVVLGREARAETLYAERAAELRGSPADDAQVVKRVGKGKSLDVVKRLGTWVMVKYEGRTGWIRRTALSTEKSGGSSASDDKKEARAKKKSRDKSKKSKKRNKVVEADPDEEEEEDEGLAKPVKAAAAGAKRLAAKRKAERRKSRSSRRSTGDEEEEAQEEEEVAAEETEPRRPRSSWGKRSSIPGGPLKVEVQASTVQAFAQPDGTGRVVFTAAEGDTVRVLSRAENRWLLVENTKKRQGWIPAVAVRDHGLLLDARKDASSLADSGSTDTAAPDAEELEIEQDDDEPADDKRKSRTAAASDGDSDDADVEEDEDKSKDDEEEDASVAAESDDDAKKQASPWSIGGGLRGGFTSVVQDITPTGVEVVQQATYSGPTAGLVGDITYRLQPKLAAGLELGYDFASASTTFNDNGTELPETYSLTHHRIAASAAVSYGEQAVTSARAGFMYAALQYSDLENAAQLPRESTSGPTVGLGFSYARIAGSNFGARVGADALLFATRSQTQGSRDGETLDSLNSLWGTLGVDYLFGKALTVGAGYRFGYSTANWVGASERIDGATATERVDLSHEIFAGVGYRL